MLRGMEEGGGGGMKGVITVVCHNTMTAIGDTVGNWFVLQLMHSKYLAGCGCEITPRASPQYVMKARKEQGYTIVECHLLVCAGVFHVVGCLQAFDASAHCACSPQ